MNVLREILTWSKDRPAWQRTALKRILIGGQLTPSGVEALTEICKSGHGLAEPGVQDFLADCDIPEAQTVASPITLISIFHHRGINALAESQTVRFHPNLTVIYGDNGAGKTGYIRILKSACRSRRAEEILGNVVSGGAPTPRSTAIKYSVAGAPAPVEWAANPGDAPIDRVSVFDSTCASVYLTEKTDVAFRPFGLDLFDHLVQACLVMRKELEAEQRAVAARARISIQLPEGTQAAKLVGSLSSLTDPRKIEALAALSSEEQCRSELLEKQILDFSANDPIALGQHLALRAQRLTTLYKHVETVEILFAPDMIDKIFASRAELEKRTGRALEFRRAVFPEDLLAGTGLPQWTEMWEAARGFSIAEAYAAEDFPFTGPNALCVLCQQELGPEAARRLRQFEEFIRSDIAGELKHIRGEFKASTDQLINLVVFSPQMEQLIAELRVDNPELAAVVSDFLSLSKSAQGATVEALEKGMPRPTLAEIALPSKSLGDFVEQLQKRAVFLETRTDEEMRRAILAEVEELRGRQIIAAHKQAIVDEIERKKTIAAYELCINETKTQTITSKSAAVTRIAVTERLTASFRNELAKLGFSQIEVELVESGGDLGILYHKVVLKNAPQVSLPMVVSEGEARCLSIAAFLAELSTTEDCSGIVFDDPVSSLDYKWRINVARRLVNEAHHRQVIVFTHDIAFLLLLRKLAEEQEVGQLDQFIRHQATVGAGICSEDLPWVALGVRKRIAFLRAECQRVSKLHREGNISAYERDAKTTYGLLREAWERGLEEVLFGGVIERHRPDIQTKKLRGIADITEDDCKIVELAVTKCSAWLIGHDQSASARAEVPGPNELEADIATLDVWVSAINRRRQKSAA